MNPFEIIITWIKIIIEAITFTVLIGFASVMVYRSFIQPWYIMLAMWFISQNIGKAKMFAIPVMRKCLHQSIIGVITTLL